MSKLPPQKGWEIPDGGGVSEIKTSLNINEAQLEFPGGCGSYEKSLLWDR